MKTTTYSITLSDKEVSTLGWAANRGYFPTETFDAMHLADDEFDPSNGDVPRDLPRQWEIPEHAAWAISMHREDDPDSLFACIGGSLLEKLINLENSIV
jgi:hypothetical protein